MRACNESVFTEKFLKCWQGNRGEEIVFASGGWSVEGARAPPLSEIFTGIYLQTINQLLSIRNKSTIVYRVYPRLIVLIAFQ